jgi:hypothetical protein
LLACTTLLPPSPYRLCGGADVCSAPTPFPVCSRCGCSTHPFTLHRSLRTRIVLVVSTLVSTSICKQILIDTKQICKGKPLQICRSFTVNETPDKKKRQKHQTNTRQKTPDQNTRQTPDMVRVRVKVEYVYMHLYLVFSSGVFCLLFCLVLRLR